MSKIRALFLGTPDFSAKILEALLSDEHYELVGVVTQPDKPRGRDLKTLPSPTKLLAQKYALPTCTPEKINTQETLSQIANFKAEVAIVVAYGQILSNDFLNLFNYGAVNIHGSLLPKWRGAAPIQRSVEAGETMTGVTLQKIVKELDAGDIIGTRELLVSSADSALDVLAKMIPLSVDLLKLDLMDFIRGNLAARPQAHSEATYAAKISKIETQINWQFSCEQIHNKVRAYLMGPGAWSVTQLGRLKILQAKSHPDLKAQGAPGNIFGVDSAVYVTTGEGVLELLEVQAESKKRQAAIDWWRMVKTQKSPLNLSFINSTESCEK